MEENHDTGGCGECADGRCYRPERRVGFVFFYRQPADNRVKPDVVAVGLNSDVMGTNGNLRKASGTSFASPILCGMVACLWQACPQLTAKEIIELVRQSGDRIDFPDNIYGYGVPDLWKAYQSVSKKK